MAMRGVEELTNRVLFFYIKDSEAPHNEWDNGSGEQSSCMSCL
jgi:hypothetical protein